MISRALGHRNLDVTRRYIDMDQEVLDEATENYATIAGANVNHFFTLLGKMFFTP